MKQLSVILAICILVNLMWAMPAQGQATYNWSATTSPAYCNDPANWTPTGGPPGAADTAILPGTGTVPALVDAANSWGTVAAIHVGDAGTARLDQIGGNVTTDFLAVGGSTGTGTLTMGGDLWSPSTFASNGQAHFGYGSGNTGSLSMSGDSNFTTTTGTFFGADGGSGTLNMSDNAILTSASHSFVAVWNGAQATLSMSGDFRFNTSGSSSSWVGHSGSYAQWSMSGSAAFSVAVDLYAGDYAAGALDLTMTGDASIDVGGVAYLGTQNGTADVTVSDTASITAGYLHSGSNTGGNADITVEDSATLTVTGGWANVGVSGGTTTLTVRDNATADFAGALYIGNNVDETTVATGTVDVSSTTGTATVNVGASMPVGFAGGDGELIIGDGGMLKHTAGGVTIGDGGGSVGAVTMNGGTFDNSTDDLYIQLGTVGGDGTWTQNGGTLLNSPTNGVYLGHGGGAATVNLNGGIFEAANIRPYGGGNEPTSATVNLNGGTLRATASDTNFLGDADDVVTPVLEVYVESGGAVIDSNGFDITVTVPLLDGTGGGGLTKDGLGALTLDGGANAYTGDTTILGGVLSITNNDSLADDASLILAVGAMLDLDFTAGTSDTIGGLWLGGTEMTNEGTYGTTASGADYTNDIYFSGDGWLLLDFGSVTMVPGDCTGDDKVTAADAEILARNWGKYVGTGGFAEADFDGDGIAGPKDAAILAANWGYGTEEASAVPEPSVIITLIGVLAGLLLTRRR